MPFEPLHATNAIEEVVFQLDFERGFSQNERERVSEAHGQWKDILPKRDEIKERLISFSDAPVATGLAMRDVGAVGINFDSYKKDGSIAWRMSIIEARIVVNCLEYTNWPEICSESLGLIYSCMHAGKIKLENNPLKSVTLHYLNLFKLKGRPEDSSPRDLFNVDGILFPKNFDKRGAFWHLHQGWFEHPEEMRAARVLIKAHLDAVTVKEHGFVNKVDLLIRSDMNPHYRNTNNMLGKPSEPGMLRGMFDFMHARTKSLMRDIIEPGMSERISLNAD